MKCSSCHTENPEHAKFCLQCGAKLHEDTPLTSATDTTGERKHVTVLFSDISGYTPMSEKLDPEEVTEIMSRIFGEVTRVVTALEGTIDKFIGDAVLAVFGLPKAHEDDAVRAILAARKIHAVVDAVSPEVEARIGRPLTMHTGINSGLIVTAEMDTKTGKAGITGNAINLASRLEGLSEAGEILVGPNTYHAAESYFTFADLGAKTVKGKTKPIHVYKVLAKREHPEQVGHLHGVRADFIGRRTEIAQLSNAFEQVKAGQGVAITIFGNAGTGKSRLVEEFKTNLNSKEIQWLEGFAYAHRQHMPYAPFIDLLAHTFGVEEGDSSDTIRNKLETALAPLLEEHQRLLPYLGSLFSLSYPEIEEVSPEFWKGHLHEGMQVLLAALARTQPTVVCFEDLHWADPSSVELLKTLITKVTQPLLFLCVYRPAFTLFDDQIAQALPLPYQHIQVHDLTASDAEQMLQSLLQTERVPPDLARFIQDKAAGNPFYLEEVVNSLIETRTLVREGDAWRVTQAFSTITIPATIQGVLTARLDRLEQEMKRIVQEASVIGREFFYNILQRISAYTGQLTASLTALQRLDLIRLHRDDPDLEYIFKHALIQEVSYNSLLKKKRREIHEQIAQVIEQLFHDRLSEFYEALAFHYTQGASLHKAVEYLMKSGKKSINRFSPEEAHHYYQEAFDLLIQNPDPSLQDKKLLVDLLIEWALVFYYRADFRGQIEVFSAYEEVAESLHDKARLGMFTAWLGFAIDCNGSKIQHANELLRKALNIGEEIDDQRVIGYACCWLAWNCISFGQLREACVFGERANAIAKMLVSEPYLYFKSLGGIGLAQIILGNCERAMEIGAELVDYGQRHANIRSMVRGYICLGDGQILASGDMSTAVACYQQAEQVTKDPLYWHESRLGLGMAYLLSGRVKEAEDLLQETVDFYRKVDCKVIADLGAGFLGVLYLMQGRMSQGMKMLEETIRTFRKNGLKTFYAMYEGILGRIYVQLVVGSEPPPFSVIINNLDFLIRHLPFARKRAEQHLTIAIELAKEIEAKSVLAQAYLDLGLLYKAKKKPDKAKAYIFEAITIFEQCGAEGFLKQAREALES